MSVSGARPSMATMKARLIAKINDVSVHVGTIMDDDYAAKYGKVWPAVWIGAIRITAHDNGNGLTEIARQYVNVTAALRILVQRNPVNSQNDLETRLATLYDGVTQSLFGWQAPGMALPFAFASSVDGPASEPSCSLDVYVATLSTYSGTNP
jgi:hypothetical protein